MSVMVWFTNFHATLCIFWTGMDKIQKKMLINTLFISSFFSLMVDIILIVMIVLVVIEGQTIIVNEINSSI